MQTKGEDYQKKIATVKYRHLDRHTKGSCFYNKIKSGGELAKGKNLVTITMKTGSTYTDEINAHNERHRYDRYQVIFGGTYEGYWRNGFKDGQGIMKNKQGLTQYEGLWEGCEPHGSGKSYNKKGKLTYEGPFRNGKSADGAHWETYKNYYLQSISIKG